MFKILLPTFIICLLACVSLSQSAKPDTAKPVTIGVTDKLYSQKLGEERSLNIYLPDDYKPDGTVKYPVIYLLDGGIDEDFHHVTGIVQFDTFPWNARIPKSIVVGIVNVDRRRDFTFQTTVA